MHNNSFKNKPHIVNNQNNTKILQYFSYTINCDLKPLFYVISRLFHVILTPFKMTFNLVGAPVSNFAVI